MSTLQEKDIKRGTLIWFSSSGDRGWSCPAVITRVDRKERTFHVRSLDDMQEVVQTYSFDVDASSPDSRRNMSLISKEKAREFVERQVRNFDNKVYDAKRALENAEIERGRYKTIASELGLFELKGK